MSLRFATPTLLLALLAAATFASAHQPAPVSPAAEPRPVAPVGHPAATSTTPDTARAPSNPDIATAKPIIQIAILLDTSGSMEGLISQARSRIWDIVNVMTTARKNGQRAEFQVAVYQYGSDHLPPGEGFLTMVQPFTTDLDAISEKLFALTIGGSEEYCGQVMNSALRQLSWNATPASAPLSSLPLRILIIAGNEPFTQGPVDYQKPVADAKQRGVLVNTIYCGPYIDGERSGWLNAAHLGGGAFNAIDQNRKFIEIPCPQDDELMRLNSELNGTYLAYGAKGGAGQSRQVMQDATNLAASPAAALSRTAAKSSLNYSNSQWDLIDADTEKTADIEKISTQDLPEIMRPMTIPERKTHIAKLKARRVEIQAQIRELSAERTKFLNNHRSKPSGETLDSAIIKAIREQAVSAGFTFAPD